MHLDYKTYKYEIDNDWKLWAINMMTINKFFPNMNGM